MDRWNRLKPETRGRLLQLFVSLDGKKAERTLRDYFEALIRVAEILGDLDRPQAVANYLSVVEVK